MSTLICFTFTLYIVLIHLIMCLINIHFSLVCSSMSLFEIRICLLYIVVNHHCMCKFKVVLWDLSKSETLFSTFFSMYLSNVINFAIAWMVRYFVHKPTLWNSSILIRWQCDCSNNGNHTTVSSIWTLQIVILNNDAVHIMEVKT